jgi:septum formation protein
VSSRPPLLLASASPRRLALLQQAGIVPDAIVPAEIDESPLPRELPAAYAKRIAAAKAEKAAMLHTGAFILRRRRQADTAEGRNGAGGARLPRIIVRKAA